MKKRRIVSLLLTVAVMIAQFSVSGGVLASSTALFGRTDFAMGVNIHRSFGYAAYRDTAKTIADARALGSTYIRTNASGDINHDLGVVNAAAKEGMDVMMTCSLSFWNSSSNSAIPADEINIDGISSSYSDLATGLRGKVKYYQIGNEMSISFIKGNIDGRYTTDFNDVSGVALAIYAAHNAIKAADPDAQTIVNFTWYHYGFLDAVKLVNIDSRTGRLATSSTPSRYITHADWDIVGFDWYAGGGKPENAYVDIIERMLSVFPDKPLIVCEANVIAKSSTDGETVTYNDTPSWMNNFVRYCYGNSRVKGFFIYELYDEPAYAYKTGSYVFNKESHFGLIDKHGNKKEMYETVRALYSGTGVASSLSTPASLAENDSVHILLSGLRYFGAYGYDAINNGWLPGSNGDSHTMFSSNIDFTNYDYIEFDCYVDNLSNLQSRVTSLTFGIFHNSGGYDQTTDFRYLLKQNGWNHVKIPITKGTSLDWIISASNQIRFNITMPASDTAANDFYAIANVCATVGSETTAVPDMNNTYQAVDYLTGVLHTMNLQPGENPYPYKGYFRLSKTLDTSIADYIEMDIYVSANTDNKAEIWVSNNRESATVRGKYKLPLLKKGWNHVVIDVTKPSGTNGSGYKFKNYEFKYPFFEYAFYSSSHSTGGTVLIANLAVTIDPFSIIPSVNNTYRTLDSIPGVNHTMTLSPGQNTYPGTGAFRLSKALDTSIADHIEMDVYVSANTDNKAEIWVSNNRESATVRGKYKMPLLKTGWNHVVLDVTNVSGTYGSGYKFKDYEFKFPFFEYAFYSSSHPTGGTVRVANISVTYDIVAPTDFSSDAIGFSNNDISFVSFDENGMYDFDFGDSRNISDTKMLELDVFVTNSSDDNVAIELMDSDGNYSDYAFTGLTVGWNHLAVRVADLRQSAENTENVNLSDIAYLTLYGNANNKVIVSNLYAADYVEGDANRDGVFDLKDVVRAKKLAAGVTTEGNKLAVSGSDYEINAVDLTTLMHNVINALFK